MRNDCVSYDRYERIRREFANFGEGWYRWIPSERELEAMKTAGVGKYLTVAAIAAERAKPENASEEARLEALAGAVASGMKFFDEKDGEPEGGKASPDGRWPITYEEYATAHAVARMTAPGVGKWVPEGEDLEAMKKEARYSLGLFMLLLEKNKNSRRDQYKDLRKAFSECYALVEGDKPFVMSKRDFLKLKDEMGSFHPEMAGWWPTKEQIDFFIRPNGPKCVDFVSWLVFAGKEPETEEERESKRALVDVLRENITIVGTADERWLEEKPKRTNVRRRR